MSIIKKYIKRLMFKLRIVFPSMKEEYWRFKLNNINQSDIFSDIYHENRWGGAESISGKGSDLSQTKVIRKEIPVIIKNLNAKTLLDIPCGDFNWMQHVDLELIDYLGADIVEDLIIKNNNKYANENIHFKKINIIVDHLPTMDIIFCRDCLVHLSFEEVISALQNIAKSGSTYLLTTTFSSREENLDIRTGEWRTLNLEVAPFNFPKPIQVINENCTEYDGIFKDKSLGLWRIEDIKQHLWPV